MWELQTDLWHECTYIKRHLFSSGVLVFKCLNWTCPNFVLKVSSLSNFHVLGIIFIYFCLCDLADSKVFKSLNSFLLSPLEHEKWTVGGVRCHSNPENYQNSDQIPGWREKRSWTTVPTGSRGGAQSGPMTTFFFIFLKLCWSVQPNVSHVCINYDPKGVM